MTLEICCDSYESILNAKNAGANRLELCKSLDMDGLTPTMGLVDLALRQTDIELFIMIRPRAGNFIYNELEFEEIKQDILFFKQRDTDGFVFGALKPDGSLNLEMIEEVTKLAYPKKVALHRAFDQSIDGEEKIDQLIDIGICRILTSGKKDRAIDGIDLLKDIQKSYGDRIEIMAGSGVVAENIKEIYDKTKIKSFHMSARKVRIVDNQFKSDLSFADEDIRIASFSKVKKACKIIKKLGK